MAETEVLESKVASSGKPERSNLMVNNPIEKEVEVKAEKQVESKAGSNVETKNTETGTKEPITFTDEQQKEFIKTMFGEGVDIDTIKERLKPTPSELTKEEKKKAQSERELAILKLYVDNGGSPDDYAKIKSIASEDKKEFARNEIINELVSEGFSKEEAEAILKDRYFQIELDNIEQDFDNETDEEFAERKKTLQKKVEYGTKKLENHSSYKQTQAQNILKGLEEAVKANELREQEEAKLSSNVDETLKSYKRKQTYELGKSDDVQLDPIEHEVSEESIAKTAEILKDTARREQFFNNKDGTLNLPILTDFFIRNFEYERAIKGALLEGQSRQVAAFEKTFPARTPYELGLGIATATKNNGKGVPVKSGKPQRVSPQYN